MQGRREELSSASPAVVSSKREPQISRSHHLQDVLGTNASILLFAQNVSFPPLSLVVLKWSTFPTTSMEHTCSSSHLPPGEPGCGHGICVLRSHSLARFWALEVRSTFPSWIEKQNLMYFDDD